MTKLGFETAPEKFPVVWESEEKQFIQGDIGPAQIMLAIDINQIINKHVFLALRQYLETADLTFYMQGGKMMATCNIAEELQSEAVFNLEQKIIDEITVQGEESATAFADALRAIANKIDPKAANRG